MTKREAKRHLIAGDVLTHRLFSDGHWIKRLHSGLYMYQDGYLQQASLFWEKKISFRWDDGWSIVNLKTK